MKINFERNFKKVKNLRVLIDIKKVPLTMKVASRTGLKKIGVHLRQDLQKEIKNKQKKTGRIYLRRLRGRMVRHQASSPGKIAANFSGEYRKHIEAVTSGGMQLKFGVRSDRSKMPAPYGKFLETGTSKMKRRPGLQIIVRRNWRNIAQIMEMQIRKSFEYRLGQRR